MLEIYKYIYVESKAAGYFTFGKHKKLIDEYSKEGWRLIVTDAV